MRILEHTGANIAYSIQEHNITQLNTIEHNKAQQNTIKHNRAQQNTIEYTGTVGSDNT